MILRINEFSLSRHFSLSEFQCPCCHTVMLHPNFLSKLEALRTKWGKAIIVNSGYRCVEHNREVGGVKGSLHRRGLAADLRIFADEQDEFRDMALYFGFTKVLCYPKRNFVHIELGE